MFTLLLMVTVRGGGMGKGEEGKEGRDEFGVYLCVVSHVGG